MAPCPCRSAWQSAAGVQRQQLNTQLSTVGCGCWPGLSAAVHRQGQSTGRAHWRNCIAAQQSCSPVLTFLLLLLCRAALCVFRKFKGAIRMPNAGYGTNKKDRHVLPNGFKKVRMLAQGTLRQCSDSEWDGGLVGLHVAQAVKCGGEQIACQRHWCSS